jgi:hypothetical protein
VINAEIVQEPGIGRNLKGLLPETIHLGGSVEGGRQFP